MESLQMDQSSTYSKSSSSEVQQGESPLKIDIVSQDSPEQSSLSSKEGSVTDNASFQRSVTKSSGDINSNMKKNQSLLNTKSYLLNSLLHFQEREKILNQLSKQKQLEPGSRNFFHGRVYNYVLPIPKSRSNKQVKDKIINCVIISLTND